MNKLITLEQAVEKVHDGMTIMFGGFLGVGSATQIIDAIVEKGVKDLTIIANDTAYDEVAHGKLVTNHQVKKAIVSHTGTNKQTALQKNEGTLIVEYVPQGTLAERIRAYGAGLGGVLTPTGLGTIMADGKDIITVDGKEYLLEKPLHDGGGGQRFGHRSQRHLLGRKFPGVAPHHVLASLHAQDGIER